MTDVWELAAYVEAHPSNHEQRWRLAKKLYTTWEYRLALEHLLILKNELEPRENVMRYLAATYYRLGRYDESAKALLDALEIWPKDTSMREQLARTQAEAGQNEDALKTWKMLHEQEPQHAFAAQAIARLQKIVDAEAKEKASSLQPVSTASQNAANANGDSTPPKEVTCPKCGEKNTPEFKHCWKCNASLTYSEDFLEGDIKKPERIEPARLPVPMAVGIVIAALFALSVYCTLRGFARVHEAGQGDAPALNVATFMDQSLLWTRVIVGAALLVIWPFAWRLAAYLTNVETRIYNESLYQSGALLALTTYALLWGPWSWLVAAPAVPAVLSALIAFFALKLKPFEAAKLWTWQFSAAVLIALLVIIGRHGPSLLIDIPKIMDFAKKTGTREVFAGTLEAPGEIRVQWQSSGSPWLDRAADKIQLTLEPGPHERRMFLEIIRGEETLSFVPVREETYMTPVEEIRVGIPYRFDVRSDDPMAVGVKLRSLLPFTVGMASIELPPKPAP